jgi:hypothetical protein
MCILSSNGSGKGYNISCMTRITDCKVAMNHPGLDKPVLSVVKAGEMLTEDEKEADVGGQVSQVLELQLPWLHWMVTHNHSTTRCRQQVL